MPFWKFFIFITNSYTTINTIKQIVVQRFRNTLFIKWCRKWIEIRLDVVLKLGRHISHFINSETRWGRDCILVDRKYPIEIQISYRNSLRSAHHCEDWGWKFQKREHLFFWLTMFSALRTFTINNYISWSRPTSAWIPQPKLIYFNSLATFYEEGMKKLVYSYKKTLNLNGE